MKAERRREIEEFAATMESISYDKTAQMLRDLLAEVTVEPEPVKLPKMPVKESIDFDCILDADGQCCVHGEQWQGKVIGWMNELHRQKVLLRKVVTLATSESFRGDEAKRILNDALDATKGT